MASTSVPAAAIRTRLSRQPLCRSFAVLLLALLGCSGCESQQSADVSGTVTLAGQPLGDGMVTFLPAPGTTGPEFSGDLKAGQFKVAKRVKPGNYTVQVRSWHKTGRIVKSPFGHDTEEIVNAVPARFVGERSELKAQLKPGPNEIDLRLD